MADNSQDMSVKGRWRNQSTRLTEDAVRDIRRQRASGVPLGPLAEQYGVTKMTICDIAKRRSWKSVH
jgi:hypothetical protein